MIRLGKLQRHALKFYATHPEGHSFENKYQTKKVIESLKNLDLLTIDEFNDAKITSKGVLVAKNLNLIV